MEPNPSQVEAPLLLFVEDDPDWTYLFFREFQNLAPHWKILCTRDGKAAMDGLAKIAVPQALVTDLTMPGVGGLELIAWVKDQPRFRSLPIVVLSSSDDPAHWRHCADLGVNGYLNKSGTLKELRNDIRYIVNLCEGLRSQSAEREEMSRV